MRRGARLVGRSPTVRRCRMAHDPISTPTERAAEHLEPRYVFPDAEAAADAKLAALGKRPNVALIVFDDVGWGDFGCYGGGVAVGAPTPNIDRLAREGKLLTSCYSEPSCTPSRASLMTGRLPMRHGLMRPPMYGERGRAAGRDHDRAAAQRRRVRDPGRRQVAHGGEHRVAAAARRASTTSTASSRSRTCTRSGGTRTSSPRSCTPRSARSGSRTSRSASASSTPRSGGDIEEVEEVTIPVLALLDDKWCTLLAAVHRAHGGARGTATSGRGSSTTARVARTSTTTRTPTGSGSRRRSIRTRTR